MWSNDMKCKYISMFCPENLARKGLILIMLNSLLYTFSSFSSYAAVVIVIRYISGITLFLFYIAISSVLLIIIFVNASSQWETCYM